MNRRPLVSVACCFVFGMAAYSLWDGILVTIAIVSFALVLAACRALGKLSSVLCLCCLAALAIGAAERGWSDGRNASPRELPADGVEATAEGTIASPPDVDGDLATFILRGESESLTGKILVRVKLKKQSELTAASKWRRGDRVRVAGELERPGDAGNFGAFDYRAYLAKQGVHLQLSAQGTDKVARLPGKAPITSIPLRALDRFRDSLGGLMERLYPDGDAGYMKGLVAGLRSDIDPEQYADFSRLGLTHVLAISGLHVAVVVFSLMQLGALLLFTRERTIALTISLLPVYMMVTGASPSVVRAVLMAMIALWLARRRQLKDGLHLLSAAAVMMLAWEPRLIEDVGFQLSFAVTAGLLLFVPAVSAALPIKRAWLRSSLAVTMTAQAVSFPLTAYYFHSFHPLSLPANLVLVPFISFVVMPLGMASVLLGAMWLPLGTIPAAIATWGNRLTFAITDWMNGWTGIRTVWPEQSVAWVVCAYALMGAFALWLRKRTEVEAENRWWKEAGGEGTIRTFASGRWLCILAAACAVWLTWGYKPAFLDTSAKAMFLDVGQGDAILIRTGEGHHVLVDAGGTASFRKSGEEWKDRRDPYEIGRKLLVPLLLERGVRKLDLLVLTHLDADHIGGAKAIIEELPVEALLFNGTVKDSALANDLFEAALDRGIPCYSAASPMAWKLDGSALLEVLFPNSGGGSETKSAKVTTLNEQNERSIVLLVTLYGRRFLLPGDLEAGGERELASDPDSARVDLAIDVLKAGHHGSKTSTTEEWLRRFRPREAIVSAGRNNLYGHPHPTVLERLERHGIPVYRTDLDGEVQYRIGKDGSMDRRVKRSR